MKKCTLILGGARSGKSRYAQELASRLSEVVLFVATGEALDEEMAEKIAIHRRSRPSNWRTIEIPLGLGTAINREIRNEEVVLLDCLTLLVSNVISQCSANEDVDLELANDKLSHELIELVGCIRNLSARFIVVSNEVGMGLVPANKLGRGYRDLLGRANQELAQFADEVLMMVAGLPMVVKG